MRRSCYSLAKQSSNESAVGSDSSLVGLVSIGNSIHSVYDASLTDVKFAMPGHEGELVDLSLHEQRARGHKLLRLLLPVTKQAGKEKNKQKMSRNKRSNALRS